MATVLDSANNLCSLAELKLFVGIATSDETLDTQLEEYINGASWLLKEETKRFLKAQSITEYHDGTGSYVIMLRHRPVNSVTTLHSDSARSFGSTTLIDSDDYQVYTNGGYIVVTDAGLDVGARVIKVVYNGGYSTIPYDLKMAAIELATYWYEKFKSHRVGLKSVSSASNAGSDTYAEDMPGAVKKAITRYSEKVAI